MLIKRFHSNKLKKYLKPNKVLVIYGPRRSGKTTLIQQFIKTLPSGIKLFQSSGDDLDLKEILESRRFSKIIPFFKDYNLIVIDEAQKISHIGESLKILVDNISDIQIIAIGSSSFELSNQVGEPLVGRQNIILLYPISLMEIKDTYGTAYIHTNLENFLIFGMYPEVLTSDSRQEKINFLNTITSSYLYKDILEMGSLKHTDKIIDLLRLLAFQIGNNVSLQELANSLDMSKNTIEKYIYLLEKSFVLIKLRGFSRNLRKEISKTSRYYFYDIGIRNAVIGNFNYLKNRDDVGKLWENFIITERIKKLSYHNIYTNIYFWRTWNKKEIDLVEEKDGNLYGYEIKWSTTKKIPTPSDWHNAYPNAKYKVITPENYLEFVL